MSSQFVIIIIIIIQTIPMIFDDFLQPFENTLSDGMDAANVQMYFSSVPISSDKIPTSIQLPSLLVGWY